MTANILAERNWSRLGLQLAVWGTVLAAIAAVLDGVLRYLQVKFVNADSYGMFLMIGAWVTDFFYLFEQCIFGGIVLFAAAKFLEARTTFTIAFDKLDAANMKMTGPDDDNVVWIGQRFATPVEAHVMAEAIQARLKASGA